ncbi:hypothetical protein EDE04_5328 [Streptomyces sp. 2132.2]|nr:hypothetical protein EDE04_5328 [Streptomyces sp. 2132.2]
MGGFGPARRVTPRTPPTPPTDAPATATVTTASPANDVTRRAHEAERHTGRRGIAARPASATVTTTGGAEARSDAQSGHTEQNNGQGVVRHGKDGPQAASGIQPGGHGRLRACLQDHAPHSAGTAPPKPLPPPPPRATSRRPGHAHHPAAPALRRSALAAARQPVPRQADSRHPHHPGNQHPARQTASTHTTQATSTPPGRQPTPPPSGGLARLPGGQRPRSLRTRMLASPRDSRSASTTATASRTMRPRSTASPCSPRSTSRACSRSMSSSAET